MIQGIRRKAIAAVSALALGVGVAVWATSAASAAPAAPRPCTTANLNVWVNAAQGNGAAGTIYYPLEFTNVSGRACTVAGFPGVSATNANGRQLGQAASRNPLYPYRRVTIPAGGTAHAILGWSDGEVYTAPGCNRTTASLIRVYPPNQRRATLGFFSLPVCTAMKGHVYLTITRIKAGPNGM